MSFSDHCCNPETVDGRYISDEMKLRSRTKYLLGSCAVYVLFTESSSNQWTDTRKATMRNKIDSGLALLRNVPRKTNPAQTLANIIFQRNSMEEATSASPWNPLDACPNARNDNLQRNLRYFLRNEGFYNGEVDKVVSGYKDPELKQALWEFNNAQRDRLGTDWAMLIVVIPNPLAGAADCGWASQELGMVVLSEYPADVNNVIAHETAHLFGPLDEYPGGPVNDPAGLYGVPNTNVGQPASVGCLMRERTASHVCEVTWNQLGLQQKSSGAWVAPSDRAFIRYEMDDNGFRYEGGIILVSDTIRSGGTLNIVVSGQSKMNPMYNPHGPDGDAATIVGSDHLLPQYPFSCVIGRWLSLDGSRTTPWFRVGSGGSFTAPFQAYFVFNVNDKKGGFGDNSGKMTLELTAKLTEQMGAPWVRALKRSSEVHELEAEAIGLLSTRDVPVEEEYMEF